MATDRFAKPDAEDTSKSLRLESIIQAFRSLDPSMPLSYIAAFLTVARLPGESVTFYAQQMGLHRAIVSRILLALGQKNRYADSGFELLDSAPDQMDRRNVRYFLTPKGQRLWNQIMKKL